MILYQKFLFFNIFREYTYISYQNNTTISFIKYCTTILQKYFLALLFTIDNERIIYCTDLSLIVFRKISVSAAIFYC